jgi:uncharacterized protein involved in exopolysaccharide biosynthesis
MNNSSSVLIIPTIKKPSSAPRLVYYLGAVVLVTFLLSVITGLYLQFAPRRYSSKMVLNLPSTNSFTRVDVPGLGGASVQNTSPYASAQDPRENYKIIASSDQVLERTAKILDRSVETMSKPKLKIVDGSTAIQVAFTGTIPEDAQAQTKAFYQALEQRLEELRQQSIADREQNIQVGIANSQRKLQRAQTQVTDYRAQSGLSSEVQIQELASNIENLRRQRAELLSERTKVGSRFQALQGNLAVSTQQASKVLKLQADPLIQETMKKYSEVTAELANTRSIYQPGHPNILQEQERQQELQTIMRQRIRVLVGNSMPTSVGIGNTNGSAARDALMQDLILSQADTQGLSAKITTLEQQIGALEQKLAQLAQAQAQLDTLKRNMQISETVFSAKLTQMDTEQANVYDAYPKMQLLSVATVSDEPVTPKRLLVICGTGAAALLINSGIVTLWLYRRKNWYQLQHQNYRKTQSMTIAVSHGQ